MPLASCRPALAGAVLLLLVPAAAKEPVERPVTEPVDFGTAATFGSPIKASLRSSRVLRPPSAGPSSSVPPGYLAAQQIPGAGAAPGDFVLQNDRISVIITDAPHASGNAFSGGYIIDGFLNQRPVDSLGQLHLYLDNTYPRMAKFEKVRQIHDTSSVDAVRILAEGRDSQDPSIGIWQTYTLRARSNVVEIETGITPTREPLTDYQVGDAFAWGSTQQFLPGTGFEASGRFFKAPWIGGQGRGAAYGYFAEGGAEISGPLGSTWIDPNVTTGTVRVNETLICRRRFVVGRDLAEIHRAWLDETGTSYSEVRGRVTEEESGRPAAEVRISVLGPGGTSVTQALSDERGEFTLWLPEGSYTLAASDMIRTSLTDPVEITLPAGAERQVEFRVASPAVVAFHVSPDGSADPVPCKVRFLGINGTPDPDLGPVYARRTRNVIYLARGAERVAVPAGDYTIVASRGIEYNTTSVTVSLKRNRETRVELKLTRAWEARGMVGSDFHLHMENSFDSAVSLEDRVISAAGEGLDFIVSTDHNHVTDLEPVISRLGLQSHIRSAPGNEITTRDHFFGHFVVFPLEPLPGMPGNGIMPFEKVTAHLLMDTALKGLHLEPGGTVARPPGVFHMGPVRQAVERVLQVNHPRAGDNGYFDRLDLSPDDATTTHPNWCDRFTALEVFNGKRVDQFEDVLRDWMNLLNLGYTYTATGNSDSHKVFDAEPGYPRNYIAVGSNWNGGIRDLPVEAVVEAVNTRHAVLVTNGPFITFTSKRGAPMGTMETRKSGRVEFNVKVEGADFVQPSSITFYGNGRELKKVEFAETPGRVKWQGTFEDDPTTDTWYVVVVRGSRSMFPVVNPIVEGRTTIDAVPLALTNPIWVDRDGDGRFAALNREKLPLMHEDRSAEALRRLDELTTQSKQRRLPRRKAAAGGS